MSNPGEPLSADDLRDNDDLTVVYTFSTTPNAVEQGSGAVAKDQPPNNQDPKPTEAAPGKPVLVRDADVTYRKVVFVGMNDPQANKEAAALDASIPKVDSTDRMAALTAVTPADAKQFYRDWGDKPNEEWVASITTLAPGQDQQLLDFLKNSINKSPISSVSDNSSFRVSSGVCRTTDAAQTYGTRSPAGVARHDVGELATKKSCRDAWGGREELAASGVPLALLRPTRHRCSHTRRPSSASTRFENLRGRRHRRAARSRGPESRKVELEFGERLGAHFGVIAPCTVE